MADRRTRLRRRVVLWVGAFVAGWLALQVVLTVTLTAVMMLRSDRSAWQECQPETVEYDYPGYCLAVVERYDVDYFVLPYLDTRTEIWIGRGDQPSYGHVVELQVGGDLDDATTQWTSAGVTFVEASGRELFTPADLFTGGR